MTPAGASPTHADQKKTFEDAVAKNPDGIAVTPIDGKEFASVIDEAIDKKIPVICFDSDSESSKRLAYLGTNNYEAGKAAGEAALKLLPEGGKFVAFVGNMSAQNAIDRYKGFQDATKGKIEMLQEPFQDQADPLKAQRNVQDAITKYGDKINGFLGIWAYDGPAILNAVESAKLLGKVKIITFDGAPETLAGLEAKKVDAAVIQKPYEFGRLSAKLLYLINRKGLKAAIEELKPELEKAGMKVDGNKIDTGVTTVTPENVAPFVENMKKLGLKST
jgi:ribose transport system substrate-binding protein